MYTIVNLVDCEFSIWFTRFKYIQNIWICMGWAPFYPSQEKQLIHFLLNQIGNLQVVYWNICHNIYEEISVSNIFLIVAVSQVSFLVGISIEQLSTAYNYLKSIICLNFLEKSLCYYITTWHCLQKMYIRFSRFY